MNDQTPPRLFLAGGTRKYGTTTKSWCQVSKLDKASRLFGGTRGRVWVASMGLWSHQGVQSELLGRFALEAPRRA